MKRIITHKAPDGDAVLSTWLAHRFLFDEDIEIVFVSRSWSVEKARLGDCVVDVGRTFDPTRLLFDHKPPAFDDRNEHCASSLVWNYLLERKHPVEHLKALVDVVHQGDHNPPRVASAELIESRKTGFHAHLKLERLKGDDPEVYAAMRTWLDENQKAQR